MKKKFISLTLTFVMVLSLSASIYADGGGVSDGGVSHEPIVSLPGLLPPDWQYQCPEDYDGDSDCGDSQGGNGNSQGDDDDSQN